MPKSYKGQAYLIKPMKSLKVNDKVFYENKRGVCFGTTMMGLQAFLTKKLTPYDQRITFLHELHKKKINLKEKLEAAQVEMAKRSEACRKKKKKFALSDEEQKLIDVWAFFDGIALYQKPSKHKKVFKKKLGQADAEKIAPFVDSIAMEQAGGLIKVDDWEGIYTLKDLETYLEIIAKKAKDYHVDVALELGTESRPYPHSLGLCWKSKKKKWILINANKMPIKKFEEKDTFLLAQAIMSGFWDKKITEFHTTLYTVANHEEESEHFADKLQQSQAFQKIHEDSSRKTEKLKKWDLINELCRAAKKGEVKRVKKLIKKGAPLNKADVFYKKTPLFLAVAMREKKTIKLLIKKGADVNLKDKNGCTVLHKAISYHDVKIIELLIKKGADLKGSNFYWDSPLHDMAMSEKAKIIHLFVKYCDESRHLSYFLQDILKKLSTQKKYQVEVIELIIQKLNAWGALKDLDIVYQFLASSNNPKLLHLLIKYQVDLDLPNKEGNSLFSIAKKNGAAGFVKYYQVTHACKNSSKKFAKYKDDIHAYVSSLDKADKEESHKVLKQYEDKKVLRKLSFFSKCHFVRLCTKEKDHKPDEEKGLTHAHF